MRTNRFSAKLILFFILVFSGFFCVVLCNRSFIKHCEVFGERPGYSCLFNAVRNVYATLQSKVMRSTLSQTSSRSSRLSIGHSWLTIVCMKEYSCDFNNEQSCKNIFSSLEVSISDFRSTKNSSWFDILIALNLVPNIVLDLCKNHIWEVISNQFVFDVIIEIECN